MYTVYYLILFCCILRRIIFCYVYAYVSILRLCRVVCYLVVYRVIFWYSWYIILFYFCILHMLYYYFTCCVISYFIGLINCFFYGVLPVLIHLKLCFFVIGVIFWCFVVFIVLCKRYKLIYTVIPYIRFIFYFAILSMVSLIFVYCCNLHFVLLSHDFANIAKMSFIFCSAIRSS